MNFTDDDLEWWKENMKSVQSKALLARLEAAEACCRTGRNYQLKREEKSRDWEEHLGYFESCWEAWCKACGK